MKQYKDCQLKGQILATLLREDLSSREIQEIVQHPSNRSFWSELYALRRRGYLTTTSTMKPYLYSLTKKGEIHAADPFIMKKHKQEYLQRRVSAILNNDESFKQALEIELEKHPSGTTSTPASITSSPNANRNEETSQLIKELKAKDDEVALLQFQVQEMRRQKSDIRQRESLKRPSPEEQKKEKARIEKRRKIATAYASRNRLLDMEFFRVWGDLRPYRLKYMQLFKPGSVEIMSRSNPEHARGHTGGVLSPSEVIGAKLFIKQYRNDGIIVSGQCMRDEKLLRW